MAASFLLLGLVALSFTAAILAWPLTKALFKTSALQKKQVQVLFQVACSLDGSILYLLLQLFIAYTIPFSCFAVVVNGLVCKDSKLVQADDFFFSGLELAGNTSNPFGSKVTPVTAAQLPVLNTLGIALVRVDYEPWGINPPHTHPRASEILAVLEGSLQVGFVT
jgi:hypothetical protein